MGVWTMGPAGRATAERATASLVAGSQDWINFLPLSEFPRFITRGQGPYVWGVDGERYIDLYCGSGSIILGHGDAGQVAAVAEQLPHGASVSLRHPVELEIAQWLRDHLTFAERTMFFKTGSEAANASLRIAHAHTGRNAALSIGYHGWLPPFAEGWPPTKEVELVNVTWNLDAVYTALSRDGDRFGAVIVSPDPSAIAPEFYLDIERAARRAGAVFVMDEIKSGFRFSFPCVSATFGLDPDIVLLSKAIANGFPVSVLTGRSKLLGDPDRFSIFSTFAAEALSLVALRATLDRLESGAYDEFARVSARLHRDLQLALAGDCVTFEGTPTFFRIKFDDADRGRLFARRLAANGVLYHPFDSVLVSAAHSDETVLTEIDQVMRSAVDEPGTR